MNNIGARIIEMRERSNITQVKLSQIIGVTKSTMSKYENNKAIPNAEVIGKIADALSTTTDYLIGRTLDYSPLEKGNEWITLSIDERKVFKRYQALDSTNKIRISERIEMLLEEQIKNSTGFFYGTDPQNSILKVKK